MCTLILLCGIVVVSWYAWLALRTRVSMSAIGSVIVMSGTSSSGWFPRGGPVPLRGRVRSPRALLDTGQLAAMGHVPEADPAQAELAVDGLGPPAPLAPGVGADAELRLASLLDLECCLCHASFLSWSGRGSRGDAAAPGPGRRSSPWSRT